MSSQRSFWFRLPSNKRLNGTMPTMTTRNKTGIMKRSTYEANKANEVFFSVIVCSQEDPSFTMGRDKTNRMSVRPAKTQISLAQADQSSLSAWKKHWVLSFPLSAQRKLWSDWADAQADLSLRWAHIQFVGFVVSRLIIFPGQFRTDI